MTNEQKIEVLQTLLGEGGEVPPEATLQAYLNISEMEILNWKYHLVGGVPDGVTSVSPADEGAQIYAVIAGYTHAGAEGEKQHNENGINRVFIYSDMIDYIRNHVLPLVRVGAVTQS